MAYCPDCGEEVSSDAAFCRSCGNEIDAPPSQSRGETEVPETAPQEGTTEEKTDADTDSDHFLSTTGLFAIGIITALTGPLIFPLVVSTLSILCGIQLYRRGDDEWKPVVVVAVGWWVLVTVAISFVT